MENHRNLGWKGHVEVQPYAQCRTVTNGHISSAVVLSSWASKPSEEVPTSFWTQKWRKKFVHKSSWRQAMSCSSSAISLCRAERTWTVKPDHLFILLHLFNFHRYADPYCVAEEMHYFDTTLPLHWVIYTQQQKALSISHSYILGE